MTKWHQAVILQESVVSSSRKGIGFFSRRLEAFLGISPLGQLNLRAQGGASWHRDLRESQVGEVFPESGSRAWALGLQVS